MATSPSAGHPATTADGSRNAIGIDIGGTKISAAIVTDRGQVMEGLTVATPTTSGHHDITAVLVELVNKLRRRQPAVEAVGVGAAGIVEWPRGFIRWAPNNSYRHLPLRDLLHNATGLPTVVDNDANVAAWAEATLGCDIPYRDMVFLTVGTGLGGGLILDGRLYRGRTGMAAELGHMVVDPHGELCGCGNHGCLEAVASGSALERIGRQAVADHPTSLLAKLAEKDSRTITGHMIHTAARDGDPIAHALFNRVGYWLGVGIASLTNIFEVEAVVIGGGLVDTGDLLLIPARESAQNFAFAKQYRTIPSIQPATFGSKAGVIGAAHLALTAADTDTAPATTTLASGEPA